MRAIAQWIFRSMPSMARIRQEGLKITFSTSLSTIHTTCIVGPECDSRIVDGEHSVGRSNTVSRKLTPEAGIARVHEPHGYTAIKHGTGDTRIACFLKPSWMRQPRSLKRKHIKRGP